MGIVEYDRVIIDDMCIAIITFPEYHYVVQGFANIPKVYRVMMLSDL
jgi:hypothetical protein